MTRRFLTLLRRHVRSRSLGFSFRGSTRTPWPERVHFNKQWVPLHYPDDEGYLADIVNVWLDDEYGLEAVSEPLTTIVDIGANIGLFSLWAWHHFPQASIIAYEPNPRIIRCAVKNLERTGASVIEAGVSDQAGKCSIEDQAASRLARTKFEPEGRIDVKSFDDVVQDAGGEIDLLKLDCEGAEWEIFRAKEAMACVKNIRMEYHLGKDQRVEDLYTVARSLGFGIQYLDPNQGFGIAWLKRKTGKRSG